MKKGKLSPREAGMLVVLVVLLIGVVYYMGFYTPLQAEMSNIAAQSNDCDDQMIVVAREIVKKIEEELEYPGQIKVNVIRESRVIDYAK